MTAQAKSDSKPGDDAMHIPKEFCKDHYAVVEPQISADGVHVWPFDPFFPIDVSFLTSGLRDNVRMSRHDYFEIIYMCAGGANLRIQDRIFPLQAGDLSIIGSTLYHSMEVKPGSQFTLAALFFEPVLIHGDGGFDSAEYLTPFLVQDSTFPHVIPAKARVSGEIFELMQKISAELPANTALAKLSVKTCLKMILMLLVNCYSALEGTVAIFERQQCALERLRPLFDHLERNYRKPILVGGAAEVCGMSESHFMNFFRKATGQTFMSYLNHYRIERAQVLLLGTGKPMSEISQETGFCDQSYFANVFHRVVGTTPALYRRKFQRDGLGGPGNRANAFGDRQSNYHAKSPSAMEHAKPGVQAAPSPRLAWRTQ